MMSDWPLVKLDEIVDITSSKRVKRADYVDEGIPFFRSKEVIERSKGNDISTELFITEEQFQKIYTKYGAPEKGDILLTSVGTLGIPYQVQVDDRFYFKDGNLTWFRNFKDTVNPKFLYYWLTSAIAKRKFDEVTIGSTQKALTIVALKSLELNLPPNKVQDHIVDILDSLDGKLTINRQTNQTLEQIAQAIFKSWFVDFDPVKAKVIAREKDGNKQAQSLAAQAIICGAITLQQLEKMQPGEQGLSHELHPLITQRFPQQSELDNWTSETLQKTADLFPDVLVESELGEVPEGWDAGSLSNIAAFTTERIEVSSLLLDTYVSTENMQEGKKGISTAASLPTVKTVPRFKYGDILISNIRPYFKKIWLARFEGGRSNDVLGLESVDQGCIEYLYNLLYQDMFFNFMMTTSSKGAKMPRGDKVAIMGWVCIQPTLEVKKSYSMLVEKFYKIIELKLKKNKYLEDIRSVLLPKLLSGKININLESELQDAIKQYTKIFKEPPLISGVDSEETLACINQAIKTRQKITEETESNIPDGVIL